MRRYCLLSIMIGTVWWRILKTINLRLMCCALTVTPHWCSLLYPINAWKLPNAWIKCQKLIKLHFKARLAHAGSMWPRVRWDLVGYLCRDINSMMEHCKIRFTNIFGCLSDCTNQYIIRIGAHLVPSTGYSIWGLEISNQPTGINTSLVSLYRAVFQCKLAP